MNNIIYQLICWNYIDGCVFNYISFIIINIFKKKKNNNTIWIEYINKKNVTKK